ncbi:hypothetical protein HY572_06315 [Candidatus Micrarchaeota archaeon]|nr:hypothetical protein [Candidatus Micrarchaeota archaeon]
MKCKELARNVQCGACEETFLFVPSEDTAKTQLSLHHPECPKCGLSSVVKLTPQEVRVLQSHI